VPPKMGIFSPIPLFCLLLALILSILGELFDPIFGAFPYIELALAQMVFGLNKLMALPFKKNIQIY
jgi:hypothetical protein